MARWWFSGCCQTLLPSHGSFYRFPGEPVQVQVGPLEPYSLLVQVLPRLPPEQLEVLPFLPQDDGVVCQAHGWIGLHLPIDQEGP